MITPVRAIPDFNLLGFDFLRGRAMDKTLFDKNGEAIAYISDDFDQTIYLFDGNPVAYLYEERHIYGINGRHLGWLINDIIFTDGGQRIGFTMVTCPAPLGKSPVKHEKIAKHQLRPRWQKPALPNMGFDLADQALMDFFSEGRVTPLGSEKETETSEES